MEKQIESMKQDVKNNLNADGAQKKSKFQIKFGKKITIVAIIIFLVAIHARVILKNIEGYNLLGNKNSVSTNIKATDKPEIDKKLDSDEDGIPDYIENIIGTDPQKADSDGDSFSDLKELKSGYDPVNVEDPSKKLTDEEFNNLKEKIKAADEEFYNKEFGNSNIDTRAKSDSFICGTSTVADIDNNIYNTVKIGDQCWLKENLKVTKNPKGEAITRYCYDNDPKICNTDGGLYDWNMAMDKSITEGAQGICPDGWHVPKDSEWKKVSDMSLDEKNLKSGASSSFELIFSGYRIVSSSYDRGSKSYYWSSLENLSNMCDELSPDGIGGGCHPVAIKASAWASESLRSNIYQINLFKQYSNSVRCLKD